MLAVLDGEDSRSLADIEIVQPTLTAVMIALAAQWRAWGIEPDAVIGQSMGEIAAAHVAGALTLEQALEIAVVRARLLSALRGQGGMLAVELAEKDAALAIAGSPGLAVAVVASPTWTVISGPTEPLAASRATLEGRGISCRVVAVDVASHGPAVDVLREPLLAALATLRPTDTRVPFYSGIDGRRRLGPALDADYWWQNLRAPARVWDAVTTLVADGHGVLLEISPHPILVSTLASGLASDLASTSVLALASCHRHGDERAAMLTSLGRLHEHGLAVDWSAVAPGPRAGRRVALPAYVFQRSTYRLPAPRGDHRGAALPFAGRLEILADDPQTAIYSLELDAATVPYAEEHLVEGERVLPGTAGVELALSAGNRRWPGQALALADLHYQRTITIPAEGSVAVQVVLRGASPAQASFAI
ncbi:MAG: acyltransferase domain-containing protein, partial [Myxococcales bacterium]|nr:acyltransferase domain-containing protein [Myxococcales bacterium]